MNEQLTLRDCFALHALTGLLSSESDDYGIMSPEYQHPNGTITTYRGPIETPYPVIATGEQRIATLAFKLADAMLAARTA